jgi:phytoene dehydrogenase-like protein
MIDAVVIGAGPNGLTGAVELARHGWQVLVLEAKDRPGGALYSLEATLPGYLHDVGAAFFPFARKSPALRALDLEGAGLQWANGEYESAHPAPDGTCAAISRDLELSRQAFGPDADAWSRFHHWQHDRIGSRLAEALLATLPALGPGLRLGAGNLLHFTRAGLSTPAGYSRKHFQTEAARRVIPGLALHADLGPHDFAGTPIGLVLALLACADGFPVPVGGARAITEAMLRRLTQFGGQLQLGARVDQVVVREKRVAAVRTEAGEEIPVRHAVLADVGAPALFLRLVPNGDTPGWLQRSMRRYKYGWGTFKMDWALSGPVPWRSAEARRAAVIHAGDSLDDLTRFTNEVRAGQLPSNPYLVIGQQSLLDPSRAPAGGQTLWAYSHAPSSIPGGWLAHREGLADRIEARIEGLAPGFRARIRARAIWSPEDLERMDENLVGGDLSGGSSRLDHMLIFRPVFPYFRYRTHIRGLYLASASAHPGGGVHGACGYNAARRALRDCSVIA